MSKLLILVLWLMPTVMLAQSTLIARLVDKDSIAVSKAVVSIYVDSQVIYKTMTDGSGKLMLPDTVFAKSHIIKLKAFNYKGIELSRKDFQTALSNKPGRIILTSEVVQLKEVIVKSNKRYRDTSNIALSNRNFKRTEMIMQAIENYGFSKAVGGQLYYKGKPVSDVRLNGKAFFGKQASELIALLPALILDHIQVVETNIDSVTNVTNLTANVKIDFVTKAAYRNGLFGNGSLGGGSSDRYIAAGAAYHYLQNEQLSLNVNTNNINIRDVPLENPAIGFAANSNDMTLNHAKVSYSNIISGKLDVAFTASGRSEQRDFSVISAREDKIIEQIANTTNRSNSVLKGISDAKLKLVYQVDPVNKLQFTQSNDYTDNHIIDSLNYQINQSGSLQTSNQTRTQRLQRFSGVTELLYDHVFRSKKGRNLVLELTNHVDDHANHEEDKVYSSKSGEVNQFYVEVARKAKYKDYIFKTAYTEPVSDNAFIAAYGNIKTSVIGYHASFKSDSAINLQSDAGTVKNSFITLGVKFQATLKHVFLNGYMESLLNSRSSGTGGGKDRYDFYNSNYNLNGSFKIDKKREVTMVLTGESNFPVLTQLVNLNAFDLIAQSFGNPNLNPERKNSFAAAYKVEYPKSAMLRVDGEISLYRSKFGISTTTTPTTQIMSIDNIGNALTGRTGLSIQKLISGNWAVSLSNSINYQEIPSLVNDVRHINKSITYNQVLTGNKDVFNSLLIVSPTLTLIYGKYYYDGSSTTITNISYSDKIALNVKRFTLDLYPLFNYNRSINTLTTFSLNGSLKMKVFGNGMVWLQAYDLFNSFRFNNNLVAPTYVQSVTYSNVSRYLILGLSFKFNNMRQ